VIFRINGMTTLTENPSGLARAGRPAGVSGRTRNPARLALATLMVVGGGLLFLSLYRARGRQVPVLIVTRDIRAGQPITDDMLGVADVAATGIDVIPVTQRESVVGSKDAGPKVALVPMKAGSLLTASQLGDLPELGADTGLVVVSLPSDAVPAGLRTELAVRVVVAGKTYEAVVFDVRAPSPSSGSSNYAITVAMGTAEAREVAIAKDARLVLLPTKDPDTALTSSTDVTTPASTTSVVPAATVPTTVKPVAKSAVVVATTTPPTSEAVDTP
jgi:SAF domain